MDLFRVLQDWGLGALVFLGLAAQPASFSEPRLQNGNFVFTLQDAFPNELQTLIDYGTEVSIHYLIRSYTRGRVRDSVVVQTLAYNRRSGQTQCRRNGENAATLAPDAARRWIATLEIPAGTPQPEQISVRAVLRLQGRTEAEAAGLWGGVPAATWRRPNR